jgi:hypothetical protein
LEYVPSHVFLELCSTKEDASPLRFLPFFPQEEEEPCYSLQKRSYRFKLSSTGTGKLNKFGLPGIAVGLLPASVTSVKFAF